MLWSCFPLSVDLGPVGWAAPGPVEGLLVEWDALITELELSDCGNEESPQAEPGKLPYK